jgi:RNA polymerase sigma-70 factor, ECF subfamily
MPGIAVSPALLKDGFATLIVSPETESRPRGIAQEYPLLGAHLRGCMMATVEPVWPVAQMPSEQTRDPVGSKPLPAKATVELLNRVKQGDSAALDLLLARIIPRLRRWAHGRMPNSARGMLETADLVQEAVISAMRRLEAFEPRHQGALQAYLRKAVINGICDVARHQRHLRDRTDLPDQLVDERTSPLEEAIGQENLARYESAMQRLQPADREAIIGRLELQHSYDELAVVLNKPTPEAARMAVTRAMKRLAEEISRAAR